MHKREEKGQNKINSIPPSYFGGEVVNDSDKSWLISGGSNSKEEDFHWLPPNTNSDDLSWVTDHLDGDVDAVWPAGEQIAMGSVDGTKVKSGAFKMRDYRNTNIEGSEKNGYYIYDYSFYFRNSELPTGWKLPAKFLK